MRKLLLALAVVVLSSIAFDAEACSRCGVWADGCAYCYESSASGALGCYLWQGVHCALIGSGECEGWGGGDPCGEHCVQHPVTSLDLPDDREWQLASVEVIRPSDPPRS